MWSSIANRAVTLALAKLASKVADIDVSRRPQARPGPADAPESTAPLLLSEGERRWRSGAGTTSHSSATRARGRTQNPGCHTLTP